jgi:hypothetical protein
LTMAQYSEFLEFVTHRCQLCSGETLRVSNPDALLSYGPKDQYDESCEKCMLHRLGRACMSWINTRLMKNDPVFELEITRDGWIQVMGTHKKREAKHLIFECLQTHGVCKLSP